MDVELKKYILTACRDLMTKTESIAFDISSFPTLKQKREARFQFTGSKRNAESIALFNRVRNLEKKYGSELSDYIAARIYKDHEHEIKNYCPNCGKLPRTRTALQCHHCFHSWRSEDRILVVLDIDETLIYTTDTPPTTTWDFEIMDYQVYKRPGLDSFLNNIRRHFDVGVWSSASDDYVNAIVEKIFPHDYYLEFVWGRSRCTPQTNYRSVEDLGYFDPDNHLNYTKPLKKLKRKLNRSLDRMLIVDDTPEKCQDNYGNAIYPSEYNGNTHDNELEKLWKYLYSLKDEQNVRRIEKRGWQNRYKTD
jgi:RNA polymerase II subunit A small phosphatase-like protein